MTSTFKELGLNLKLIDGLKAEEINIPTDIQIQAIPDALQNKDIIGQSQTGSGKTLAYLLPLFEKIDSSKKEMQAIILSPTHELAMQIHKEISLLSQNSGIPVTSTPIIAQVNILRQIDKLKEKPHIIVGSTGRVLELIKKRKITAHTIKTIIIDEGDRMLDENNLPDIREIIKATMRDRQLMVFSATINANTLNIAKELMTDPKIIKVENKHLVNSNITHMYFVAEQRDKIEILRKLNTAINPERAIIFINKSDQIQITTSKLQYHHLNAYGIYGAATKEERQRALEGFRNGKINFLVASDLAARGLDIKGVSHVFNLDLPENPKDYLHRAGRTGRVNEPGVSISIVTEKELTLIRKYEQDLNIKIEKKTVFKGAIIESGTRKSFTKKSIK
ncbi:MAG: DEAD/DEAH box helicase [Clostridia bacterium]